MLCKFIHRLGEVPLYQDDSLKNILKYNLLRFDFNNKFAHTSLKNAQTERTPKLLKRYARMSYLD